MAAKSLYTQAHRQQECLYDLWSYANILGSILKFCTKPSHKFYQQGKKTVAYFTRVVWQAALLKLSKNGCP